MQKMIPAALFATLEGLAVLPVMAGDGVVILQREVPDRPAYRPGTPGRPVTVDVSPDDKVNRLVGGQHGSLNPAELGDADFAAINTGTPQALGLVNDQMNKAGLSDARFGSDQLNGAGGTYGAVQSLVPGLTGSVGAAVGGATGRVGAEVTGMTGALSGLTGAITRGVGQ